MKLLIALLSLALAGCGPVIRNTGKETGEAPTSTLPRSDAEEYAKAICKGNPALAWSRVAPTGSMEPLLNSYAIIITEPTDGSDLKVGQIIVFFPNILHRVAMLNDTHFITDGVSNQRYDGWIERGMAHRRLVAIFYTNAPL